MCRCGKVVSTNASPPPEAFSVIRCTDKETALHSWGAAAAQYVEAVEHGRRGSWVAEHFSHLPDATHEEVLSDLLVNYLQPHGRIDIICPHCGRLWRQDEPGGSAHRPLLPED
jgi:hypothetical protein